MTSIKASTPTIPITDIANFYDRKTLSDYLATLK
jgi:hypothetical protein